MSIVQRGDIVKNVTDTLGILPAHDPVAKHVQPMIVPTVNVENFNTDIVRTLTTSGTLFTTPNDRDFFLTNVAINSADGNANSDNDNIIVVLADGSTQTFRNEIAALATSTGMNNLVIQFEKKGVLLKRNTAITSVQNLTQSFFMIAGYTRDKY